MNQLAKWTAAGLMAGTLLAQPRVAAACGCLALPSPATPVVQAGERILFAKDQDQIVAYIQIQYAGAADQFGWLVPLPSVPTLELGTDELFTKLGTTTQPGYQLTTTRQFCSGGSSSSGSSLGGCGSEAALARGGDVVGAADGGTAMMNPVVITSSIGPYDYAVLKADDQTDMLGWLQANRYFVPAGTDQAMAPYVHPGAFFLALKLRAGESTGDIVPVVVRYQSDLPMIPIILTQVGAVPNMGIQVWELGEGRAVPRNYHHVVLDEMNLWLGESYSDLIVRAVHDAPKRHAFLTEYAGPSAVMANQLDYPGRFGNLSELRLTTDPSAYLRYLKQHDFPFDSTLVSVLERFLPLPPQLNVTPLVYYQNYDQFASPAPVSADGGAPFVFDPIACTDELEQRIVVPSRKTATLFTAHPYLTRLFTVLSPEDMTDDPVFGENRELPDVPLLHHAVVTIPCRGDRFISTDQGLESLYTPGSRPSLTGSLRVEILGEAGPAEVVVDNTSAIQLAIGKVDHGSSTSGSGCDVPAGLPRGDLGMAALLLGALIAIGWRRRRPFGD